MNGRTGAWLTGEEPLQTVIDVMPSVVGMDGNGHSQKEPQYRHEANAPQGQSIEAHLNNSSSVFSRTLSKKDW